MSFLLNSFKSIDLKDTVRKKIDKLVKDKTKLIVSSVIDSAINSGKSFGKSVIKKEICDTNKIKEDLNNLKKSKYNEQSQRISNLDKIIDRLD